MKVMLIPFITGELRTVCKRRESEKLKITGRAEFIQTTALFRSAEYREKTRRLDETCCHSNFSERPSAYADVKNSKGVIIIIMIAFYCNVFFLYRDTLKCLRELQ